MRKVIIRFWPIVPGWEELVDDIESLTGLTVARQIKGQWTYQQRNIYAELEEEDAVYLALKYNTDIVELGEEVDHKHKLIGL